MQIRLHPDSYKLLAFEFEGQVYLMTQLAFGTSVSSSIFNRYARTAIFGNETVDPEVRVYVDDVKVESDTFDSYLEKILKIVKNISDTGMAFSLEKMSLIHPSLKYLGFEIKRGLITKGGKYRCFLISSTLNT